MASSEEKKTLKNSLKFYFRRKPFIAHKSRQDFFPSFLNTTPRAGDTCTKKKNPQQILFVVIALEQSQSKGTADVCQKCVTNLL